MLQFTPADLHPAASESFADILRSRLRSVLCVVNFRSCMRGIGEPSPGARYNFAQTFPLYRRGLPVGAFRWLDTDPQRGVEFDLFNLPLSTDPRHFTRGWEKLEKAFGINERAKDDGFRFYICPTLRWPRQSEMLGQARPLEGWREELAQHLREGEADWLNAASTSGASSRVSSRAGP
jgi:hypothetical protein